MGNWYATREQVKRAGNISGADADAVIDRLIEAASRTVESDTGRFFLPITATRYYDWPPASTSRGWVLWLDEDLLAVTLLQTGAQDTSPVTIAATDYFLEPVNSPPYNRVEIDLSSNAGLTSGTGTPQRSVAIQGRWGYCENTVAAGALAEADDGSETALDVTDSSLIGVGDTILIGTEAMFVTAKGALDTTANTSGALTANKAETTVPVNDGTKVLAGEVILIDSERMLVSAVAGNTLTVIRAYDGTVLATHANPSDVYAFRTLTVTRAANGTVAATHALSAAIRRYVAPLDVVTYTIGIALALFQQEAASYGRTIGAGADGAVEYSGKALAAMKRAICDAYDKVQVGAI